MQLPQHESDELFSLFMENFSGAVFIKDREDRITYCNRLFAGMVNATPEELIGKKLEDKMPANLAEKFREENRRIIEKGETIQTEHEFPGPHGKTYWVNYKFPIKSRNGETYIGSISLDMTDQHHMIRALTETKKRQTLILDATTEMFAYYNTDFEIQWANKASADSVGLAPAELVGKHCYEVWQMRDAPCDDCPLLTVLKTGEPAEAEMETPNGRIYQIRGYPITDNQGELTALVEFGRDVTKDRRAEEDLKKSYQKVKESQLASINLMEDLQKEIHDRKQAEEQISASLKEKEILLREIHHRVKNNMQIIISLLNLQQHQLSDDNLLTFFEESKNRIFSMALVHEQLYESKNLSRIDLCEYIKNLVQNIKQAGGARSGRISLKVDIPQIFLTIEKAIPCGLIVNELLTNAIKHAFPNRRKGVVEISMDKNDGPRCSLQIRDNGVGLPKNIDINKSSSLGLVLVSLLTEQLNGDVRVERNRGTAFTIGFDTEEDSKAFRSQEPL